MKILTVPHQTLRSVAQPVTKVDKKLLQIVDGLTQTLERKTNPRGVGLAAPQIDSRWRLFATLLATEAHPEPSTRIFINPELIRHSDELTLGPDPEEPTLEGCLSIPGFYGPVPRWTWIELQFQVLEGTELVTKTEKFAEFAARVVQHEHDHLDGVLFVDYTLKYGLPLYQEDKRTEKLYELDEDLVHSFVHSTLGTLSAQGKA